MREHKKLSMIILAGGLSTRMGRDKAGLLLQGKTFLELQIDKGRTLGIQDILVSGYRGEISGVRLIRDRYEQKGPLGGLEAALREAKETQCLVLGVDIPLVPAEELQNLIREAEENVTRAGGRAIRATILEHNNRQEPLIGVYDTSLADEMEREVLFGKGSVFALLRKTGYGVYKTSSPDFLFQNINNPDLYRECEEYLNTIKKS